MTASSELICFKTNFDPRGRAWLRFLLQPKPLVHAPTTSHKSSHCSCTQLTLHNTHRGSMPRLLGIKKKKKAPERINHLLWKQKRSKHFGHCVFQGSRLRILATSSFLLKRCQETVKSRKKTCTCQACRAGRMLHTEP